MDAILAEHLTIVAPGPIRRPLARLATFRRKGRKPPTEARVVRAFHNAPDAITVPRGLLPRVKDLAPARVVDKRLAFESADFGWRGSLYPYQAAAAREIYRLEGGVVVIAPGGGKTRTGLALAAIWGQPTLWLCHTKELATQAMRNARELYHLPPSAYGTVIDGIGPSERQRPLFTVAMVQSLANNPDLTAQLARKVGTVIVDESHHAPSATFQTVIGRFPAKHRVGLSATPDRTDGLGPLMVAMLGDLVVVPLRTLVAAGRVLLPRVEIVRTSFEMWVEDESVGAWNSLEAARAQDRERNRLILALALRGYRAGRKVLVLVNRKDHARALAKALNAEGAIAFAATGEAEEAQRARWFSLLERGQAVVIATRLADEGLDLPRLDTLILGAAARSRVRLEQQVGRVMRTAGGKKDAVVYDLADTLVPAYRRQVSERVAYYREVGYELSAWSVGKRRDG